MTGADTLGTLKAKWDIFVHNKQLGIAWIIAALAGAFVISVSHELDFQRFFLPVVVMLVYAVLAFNRAQMMFKQLSASSSYQHALVSQMADSVYFLGFLWTLWALIDSFVLKSNTATTSVFRTFGYALVTTSCGTFLRLAILQFRFTSFDQSFEAEMSIEEKLQQIGAMITATESILKSWNTELRSSAESFTRFNTNIKAAVDSALDQHKRLVDVTSRDSQESIKRLVDDLAKKVESAITGSMAPLKTETTQAADAFKKANASLRKSVPAFTDRLEGISGQLEKTQATLGALDEDTEKVRANLDRLASSVTDLTQKVENTESARAELMALVKTTMGSVGGAAASAMREAISATDWRQILNIKLEQEALNNEVRAINQRVTVLQQESTTRLDTCIQELRAFRSPSPTEQELLSLLKDLRVLMSSPDARRTQISWFHWPR